MKKVVSLLLAGVMVLSLAACGGKKETTAVTTAPAESKTETEAEPQSESSGGENTGASQIVYGVTSTIAGDMGLNQWSSVGGDKPILFLINAYSPTCYDQDALWLWDETVVESHDARTNDDGTLTYTIQLKDDLYFSDGSKITAKNYVAYPLLFSSPAAVAVSAYGTAGKEYVGHQEYKNGENSVFAGLHLVDDRTFSITVAKDYNPYYYGLALLNIFPMAYEQWLPDGNWDIADDGDGCYFKGDVEFDGANCGEAITAGRYLYEGRICSGPYYLESLDTGAGEATLKVNEHYNGNFEGQKADIETIIVKAVNSATMLDALKTGSVDLIDGIGEGDIINACLDLADTGEYGADCYKYSGYMKLFYQCDWGPTQYEPVRKAVAY